MQLSVAKTALRMQTSQQRTWHKQDVQKIDLWAWLDAEVWSGLRAVGGTSQSVNPVAGGVVTLQNLRLACCQGQE